jgi:hypothetical protein
MGLAGLASADDGNQALADRVAQQVTQAGTMRGYQLDIETQSGVVTLSGRVADERQRADLIQLVKGQTGVVEVKDQLQIASGEAIRLVSDVPMTEAAPAPAGELVEPEPVYNYQGGIAPYSDSPVVPPYSWPAYTPYNNFASMAYQTQYPSGAWPFIGPPYPYPMIPSGWRRVSLTWKKGYWWMRFHAH